MARTSRRSMLMGAGGALVLGWARVAPAAGRAGAGPTVTVHKSPT